MGWSTAMKRRARYAAMVVGCVGLAATLSVAGSGLGPAAAAVGEEAEDQRVQIFSLKEIIEPAASDPLRAPVATPAASVLTAVEAALAAAREEGEASAEVTFHDESGLLIVRGEEPEIDAVREVLELIREDVRRARAEIANREALQTLHTRTAKETPEIDKARRADLEAALRLAMIEVERAQLEVDLRAEKLHRADKLAKAGNVSQGEVRELRTAFEHARLAMHEAEVKAGAMRRQLEAVGQGPEAIERMRRMQGEDELRMAMIAIERAQADLAAQEAAFADARAMVEKDFVSEGELRERRVAMERSRLDLEQAQVMAQKMRARVEATAERREAQKARPDDEQALRQRVAELVDRRSVLHRHLSELRASGNSGRAEIANASVELRKVEDQLALAESRLAEAGQLTAELSKRKAEEAAIRSELERRNDQLARLEAELAKVREIGLAQRQDMVTECTRLEVRLEETQRALERKHMECAEMSDRLRQMMVRVEVEAARRAAMEEEIHRLRKALEECRGEE